MQLAIPFSVADLLPAGARRATSLLDGCLGLATLQRLYATATASRAWQDFPELALTTLGIQIDVAPEDLERVPATGPLVVVANHPRGAADGLAITQALRRVRPDVRLLGNELLSRIPEMREHLITVDIFRAGARRNGAAIRAALDWLRDGHVLVIFPAGGVSHVTTSDGRVVDDAWHEGAARLAARADAPVLPVFIEGRNSAVFLAAGRVHPIVRTALLPRELLRQRGSTIGIRIGRAVSARRLEAIGDTAAQTAYLRVRTYGPAPGSTARPARMRLLRGTGSHAAVAPEVPADRIAAEIDALPANALLLQSGAWVVFCAEASAIPDTLMEIGRLRELTFRDTGEGTGTPRDLDRFDLHYRHLFVWNRERRLIAGAYRVGATDRVVASRGVSGLYTRTLFRYPRRLIDALGPALELGRSFVRPELQRDYQPLLLLWKGIGRLVAQDPRYRVLLGPVSISAEYGAMTREILAKFLLANRYSAELGALVRPNRPLPREGHDGADALVRSRVVKSLDDVEQLVRELETDRRGMPVLLRQYLKLNAKLLGFSVDPAFGHVLDGLVVVDLLDVDRPLLTRYLGKEGADVFLELHRRQAGVPGSVALPQPQGAPA